MNESEPCRNGSGPCRNESEPCRNQTEVREKQLGSAAGNSTEPEGSDINEEACNRADTLARRGRRMTRLMWVLLLAETAATSVLLKILPETIPMHFSSSGKADRYGSKYELIVLLVFSLFAAMVSYGRTKTYKEKAEAAEDAHERAAAQVNRYVSSVIGVIFMLIMSGTIAILAISGRTGLKPADELKFAEFFVMAENFMIAVIMIVFGNIMPKSRRNGMFGVRTGWSSYNDETWAQSNRIGGKLCVATGILCIPVGMFVNYRYSTLIIVGMLTAMAIAATAVSYRVYCRVKKQEEKTGNG